MHDGETRDVRGTPRSRRPARLTAAVLGALLVAATGLVSARATGAVGATAPSASAAVQGSTVTTTRIGYWMLGADGVVYAFGYASGSTGPIAGAVSLAPKLDGSGYWVTDLRGGVHAFGAASYFGGSPKLAWGEIVTTMSATPSGKGYWLFTSLGRVFRYGDAQWYGDMASRHMNAAVIASVATPTGRGYYMVGTDGGVFAYGDARFHGSTGGLRLNRPIIGISPTRDNRGYWLVATDGGVFAFQAPYRGSLGGTALNRPISGLVAFGNGYLMAAGDGGVFNFSNKPFLGSLAGRALSAPILDIASFAARVTVTIPPTRVVKARPFASASMWNTPTPVGTKWFNTSVLHTGTAQSNGDTFRHWTVSTGAERIWWSSPLNPVWTFKMPAFVAPAWHRNRPAATFTVRAPANLAASTDSDHILTVADPATGNYVEVWRASVDAATRTVTSTGPGWARGNMISGHGGGTLTNNDGVRAANFSWMGGLITGADFTAGKINHGLAVSLPYDMLKPGAWRAPATAWETIGSGPVQMGSRIGIPAGTAMPAGLSPLGVMVFNALRTYGAFVGDFTGGPWPIFYADQATVAAAKLQPLFAYWNYGGSADMEKIGPLLRIADYQP